MNFWPFNSWQAQGAGEELANMTMERDHWKDQYKQLAMRDLETEHVQALNKQIHILGERAKMHDHMMLEHRKLRTTVKEIWPRDLEIAEETGLGLVDLVIWLIREKPGPGMPAAQKNTSEKPADPELTYTDGRGNFSPYPTLTCDQKVIVNRVVNTDVKEVL